MYKYFQEEHMHNDETNFIGNMKPENLIKFLWMKKLRLLILD